MDNVCSLVSLYPVVARKDRTKLTTIATRIFQYIIRFARQEDCATLGYGQFYGINNTLSLHHGVVGFAVQIVDEELVFSVIGDAVAVL